MSSDFFAFLSFWDFMIMVVPLLAAAIAAWYMNRFNKSVAGFLAANRTAGRYLICTAQMETGVGTVGLVAGMEQFSQAGFSLNLWGSIIGFSFLILSVSGLITYRFRETRALTFHQFFEQRYSKGVRVWATGLNVFSGLFTFGLVPGITARFFVYLLGMPTEVEILGATMPTMLPVMIVIMALCLFFSLSGGHLSVMMADCVGGLISSLLFLVVSFAVLMTFSYSQMADAMVLASQPGKSFVDPFDISKQEDFGHLYMIIFWFSVVYFWRGNAWNASFTASAKSAHESQMANILGVWRNLGNVAMTAIIGLGAFVLMHSPDYQGQAEAVRQHLEATIPETDKQLRTQLTLPTALGTLLPEGIKGALAAIMLLGTVAGVSSSLFNFSTGLIQDVFLPLYGKHLGPQRHIRLLRATAIGLAIYSVIFSMFFRIPDFLNMLMALLGGIYLAGIGCVVWGGLYWSRATTAGAWTSLITGGVLSTIGVILQQIWPWFAPWLAKVLGPGPVHDYLLAHAEKLPLNGQVISAIIMLICLILFIVVSLLTCKEPHNMDKMLHRGQWAVEGEKATRPGTHFDIRILAGITEHFSRGDKIIAIGVFLYGLIGPLGAAYAVAVNTFGTRWSPYTWFDWHFAWNVVLPLAIGVLTFVWFTWGALVDMRRLVVDLEHQKIDDKDDGLVTHEDEHAAPAAPGDHAQGGQQAQAEQREKA
ncbi:MAG: hypothetical protein RMM29_08685 [Planctomycetota bacterium]|nr:hypothetical protein [Planctomycetota bacterium]MDW8373703.1 hypothetical protein [Planctomycetota bacterium]